MSEIPVTLQNVFRRVFDDDSLEICDETSANDIAEWDSVRHIDLIIAIEAAFGVRFATAEIARLKRPDQNVGALLQLLGGKLRRK